MQTICLLCAANQLGKSQVQIWRFIEWSTNRALWEKLWDTIPKTFWYLYPTKDIVSMEFRTKIEPFLPRGDLKNSRDYGWKLAANQKKTEIRAIEWNNGLRAEFKTYAQNVHHLQAGTIHYVACDEELPEILWPELRQRFAGVKGYFSAVFTATRNQLMWLRAIEGRGQQELFPDAFKRQISKYDCLVFDDGSPGLYTEKQIKIEESEITNKAERDRRIFGKFATSAGRRYWAYDPLRHIIKPKDIPEDWEIYSGVDIGTGGGVSHPAAIAFVAVRPDYRLGYVFKGARFDNEQTTAGDVLNRYRRLRGKMDVTQQVYDWQAKDFSIIAERQGEAFSKADKSQDMGRDVMNSLFSADMLFVFDDEELNKFGQEAMTLMMNTTKQNASDDFCDAIRFCLMAIPWDWVYLEQKLETSSGRVLNNKVETEKPKELSEVDQRRLRGWDEHKTDELEDIVSYWNEQYGTI